jgi:hypothetical protein
LLVREITDCVTSILDMEGRPCRYDNETYTEARERRMKISDGIVDFLLRENGWRSDLWEPLDLDRYLDCCDLNGWCERLRLAMDAIRRGYGDRELRFAVALRLTLARTETETGTISELRTESGADRCARRPQVRRNLLLFSDYPAVYSDHMGTW